LIQLPQIAALVVAAGGRRYDLKTIGRDDARCPGLYAVGRIT
jgi:hypothetical protein